MILADTSAWVEFDRATGSVVDSRLTELLHHGATLVVTEPVAMELLAGARSSDREADLRRLIDSVELVPFDTGDFDRAAWIYRTCRRAGVTPRGLRDCMIAAVAWREGLALLTRDVDLVRIAQVVGIALASASTARG